MLGLPLIVFVKGRVKREIVRPSKEVLCSRREYMRLAGHWIYVICEG